MPGLQWQKSSFSSGSGSGECVQVTQHGSSLHLRESEEPTVVLTAPAVALEALLTHIKSLGHGQV